MTLNQVQNVLGVCVALLELALCLVAMLGGNWKAAVMWFGYSVAAVAVAFMR